MSLSQVNALFPLIMAGGYAVLLIILLVRHGWQEPLLRWLQFFIIVSLFWQLLLLPFPIHKTVPNLPFKTLLVATVLLGGATAFYIDRPWRKLWPIVGGLAIVASVLVDVFAPALLVELNTSLHFRFTAGGVFGLVIWFGLWAGLLAATWRSYQRTPLPFHADRLLYWEVTLLATVAAEGLLFSSQMAVNIAGQGMRLLATLGLAYAVSSHRIFDVRTRLRRSLAFFLITVLTAGLAALILLGTEALTWSLTIQQQLTVLVLVVAAGLLVYQPFYRLVERFLYRTLLGTEFDTGQALRRYSRAIARTLEVEPLAVVIVSTFSQLLRLNRGAVMLVSQQEESFEVQPIRAMGNISTEKKVFSPESPFINALAEQRQPLLQYEIDFNPSLQGIDPGERAWLREQAMDLYVPIATEAGLAGFIALGPKSSGRAYRPYELELMQVMADQSFVSLQNARLYSELGAQNERIRLLNADLRKQNERLAIVDRVKSDFITIASHELRTPLTQVTGFSDVLQEMNEDNTLTPEQLNELAGYINKASQRLERLIEAMLEASQLDLSGVEMNFAPAELETVVSLAAESLSGALDERRIDLVVNGVQEVPAIQADLDRLVLAFQNVFSNAVKYTPDGGQITVSASKVQSEDEADFVEVVVADTGIGIDRAYQQLIFEKFFRVGDPQLHSSGSTKFLGGGPGLGLPIAKGVIEAHNGRIWVESDGQNEARLPGSRFHILLPTCAL